MKKPKSYPRRAQDAFVNQKMLYSVRDELIERISASNLDLKSSLERQLGEHRSDLERQLGEHRSGFEHQLGSHKSSFEHQIGSVRSEIEGLRGEMRGMKAELKADIHDLKASVHKIALLVEEQNNRNKIVLDGLAHIIGRQDRLEGEWIEFKK